MGELQSWQKELNKAVEESMRSGTASKFKPSRRSNKGKKAKRPAAA